MANTQSAFGFQHFGYLPGSAVDYQLSTRLIQSSNTTKIFFGDPVVKGGATAYIVQASSTTAPLDGIFQGCTYIPSTGGPPVWSAFWPGASAVDATAYVMKAPGALFRVAANNTAITTTNIGSNVIFATGTGVTTGGGFSGFTVSTVTTDATAPFEIVSLYPGIGNGSDPTTPFNWVIVTFNNQTYRAGAVGVA
jgi:hypothetical protein